eukprot:g15044.t1
MQWCTQNIDIANIHRQRLVQSSYILLKDISFLGVMANNSVVLISLLQGSKVGISASFDNGQDTQNQH